MKRHHLPMMLLLSAFLAIAAAPAFADKEKRDCNEVKKEGGELITKAEAINAEIRLLAKNRAKNHKEIQSLKTEFRAIRSLFDGLRQVYSRKPPCGSGDLERDLERKFPDVAR